MVVNKKETKVMLCIKVGQERPVDINLDTGKMYEVNCKVTHKVNV